MLPFADMQPEQVAKVRGDLGVTQQNMAVFSEMLSELKPGLEHPEVCLMYSQIYRLFNWLLRIGQCLRLYMPPVELCRVAWWS